jgi:hypothetical protein
MIYFNKKVIIRIKFECIRVAHEKIYKNDFA